MAEVFEVAEGLKGRVALERAAQMLARVQIASPERVLRNFPHELSGGMQQRVVIAMALSMNPGLLILDEPTTGLDATVEAEVLDLIAHLRAELGNAILFISHNLPVVARMCDRVGVLYAGELVEEGPAPSVFRDPRHPYTVGLVRCVPAYGARKNHGRLETIPGFLPAPGTITGRCVFADRCAQRDRPLPRRSRRRHRSRRPAIALFLSRARARLAASGRACPAAQPGPRPREAGRRRAAAAHAPLVQDLPGRRQAAAGGARGDARSVARRDPGARGGVRQRQELARQAVARLVVSRRRQPGGAGRRGAAGARRRSDPRRSSRRCRSCFRTPARRSIGRRPCAG